LNKYEAALVEDDHYYEMVALYGFERFGPAMTIEQLGDMWKEYRAGTWGLSEQARLALERGIERPATGRAAGATALKIAMFDEVNEGTAIFKAVSKRSDAPDQRILANARCRWLEFA
jgi:hypothetical protein